MRNLVTSGKHICSKEKFIFLEFNLLESYLILMLDIQLQWYFRDFLRNLRRINVFVFASAMAFIVLVWSRCSIKDWICKKEDRKIPKLLEEILKYLHFLS